MSIRAVIAAVGVVAVNLTIATNQTNYNVRTAAGSPAGAVAVTVTVNSSITVGSTSTSNPSMDWGTGWAAGSTFKLINNGTVEGAGGNGAGLCIPSGAPGGNAMDLRGLTVAITNGSGDIWGGGGGGGGGSGGGGGGGGAGNVVGLGGPAPSPGTNGTATAGGAGGPPIPICCCTFSHAGGNGGNPGQPGQTVDSAGGAAGKAINLNGGTANFQSGGSSPNVKGAVS